MHLTLQQISKMDRQQLEVFLSLKINECQTLDYKRSINLSSSQAKLEMLKDISAFANAAGGHIIYGCDDPTKLSDNKSPIIGLENGDKLARQIEQSAASSIDPSIPGLQVINIDVGTNLSCLIVHVPPSFNRPHMVTLDGHNIFYKRHSESIFRMTTYDIGEAFFTKASAEEKAKRTIANRKAEVFGHHDTSKPYFFIQAVPLISPESKWDVLSEPFKNIIRGTSRRHVFHHIDLYTTCRPSPTIDGIAGIDDRDQTISAWRTEIHRTGYLSASWSGFRDKRLEDGTKSWGVYSTLADFFRAFTFMLNECLELSRTDVPYVIACTLASVDRTHLWLQSTVDREFIPYPGKGSTLDWPFHIREAGQNPMKIAEELALELFYAFGEEQVRN